LVQSIGTMPTTAGVSAKEYEPLWWLFFFATSTGIALIGCNYTEYWMFIRLIGGLSLLLLVIFILGSFSYVDYDQFHTIAEPVDVNTFTRIYQCAGMFRGVQYLPLVSVKLADVSQLTFLYLET